MRYAELHCKTNFSFLEGASHPGELVQQAAHFIGDIYIQLRIGAGPAAQRLRMHQRVLELPRQRRRGRREGGRHRGGRRHRLGSHHHDRGQYSWWDYRGLSFPFNKGLRIDFVFATPPLASVCTAAAIDRNERKGEKPSDHAPCIAEFKI